ncbi:MAG: flagellar FlbD family protein [Clostridia bacterium]|nr:flagellar FlbD family protein [Clostridia bacterium]
MIEVTRLNGTRFYVNDAMIEFLEETPDTIITLNTEKKLVVKESIEEILIKIVDFRRRVYAGDTAHITEKIKGEIK